MNYSINIFKIIKKFVIDLSNQTKLKKYTKKLFLLLINIKNKSFLLIEPIFLIKNRLKLDHGLISLISLKNVYLQIYYSK